MTLHKADLCFSRARAEPDGTRAETTFCLPPKRTSPFKSAWESVQSTAGSRVVRISVSNAEYTTCQGGVRVLVTRSIRQFSLHFPSRASPCATTFRTQYTAVCGWSDRADEKQKCWPVHATKVRGGNSCAAPLTLIFDSKLSCVVKFPLRPLYPRTTIPAPIAVRLDGPQSRSEVVWTWEDLLLLRFGLRSVQPAV